MATSPRTGSPDWFRPLGRTGLRVSAVCAGGSPLGRLPRLYGHDVSADQGVATVRAVLDSPIRVIDTSNAYSDGESERRIGEALAVSGGVPRDFLVVTKVDARGRDYSAAPHGGRCAGARRHLGRARVPAAAGARLAGRAVRYVIHSRARWSVCTGPLRPPRAPRPS